MEHGNQCHSLLPTLPYFPRFWKLTPPPAPPDYPPLRLLSLCVSMSFPKMCRLSAETLSYLLATPLTCFSNTSLGPLNICAGSGQFGPLPEYDLSFLKSHLGVISPPACFLTAFFKGQAFIGFTPNLFIEYLLGVGLAPMVDPENSSPASPLLTGFMREGQFQKAAG